MNVSKIMQCKVERSLTFERMLECKKAGRPNPKLDLAQITTDRGKSVNRYFRESMYDFTSLA